MRKELRVLEYSKLRRVGGLTQRLEHSLPESVTPTCFLGRKLQFHKAPWLAEEKKIKIGQIKMWWALGIAQTMPNKEVHSQTIFVCN